MIIYDINYQLTNDIDWFIADSNNTIVHFASGGGILPKMVVENIKSNILLINFFREIQNNTDIIVNPTLINYWPPKSISDENLESFKQFARKGIISFDKTYIDNPEDITYHMVTSPNVN